MSVRSSRRTIESEDEVRVHCRRAIRAVGYDEEDIQSDSCTIAHNHIPSFELSERVRG